MAVPAPVDRTCRSEGWLGTISVFDRHHVFWVSHGNARVMISGEVHRVDRMEALWIPAGTAVDQIITSTGAVTFSVLLPVDGFPTTTTGIVHRTIDETVNILLLHLYVRWIGPTWDVPMITPGIRDALNRVFFGCATGDGVRGIRMPVRGPAVAVADRLMDEVLCGGGTTCEELARYAGTSVRALSRNFRRETGMTVTEWTGTLKMSVAVDRLRAGHRVSAVAHLLGYSDTAAFSRAFSRHFGVPPSRCAEISGTGRRERSAGAPEAVDVTGCIPPAQMFSNTVVLHVLVLVLAGRCTVRLWDRSFLLEQGDMLWQSAGVPFDIVSDRDSVIFPVSQLPADVPLFRGDMKVMHADEGLRLHLLRSSAFTYTRLRAYPPVTGLVDDLLPEQVRGRTHPSPVARIIRASVAEQLTTAEWAGTLGVSQESLDRTFRRCIGMPYHEWVVERRMTVGRKLLENPDRRVAEAAVELGYSSSAAFVRTFKDRVGMTPGEYQRRYRKREMFEAIE